MIKTRTVLVLGAGAGVDFGFPSGRGLLQRVISQLGMDKGNVTGGEYGRLYRVLQSLGHTSPFLSDFRSALSLARPSSIDALLESRREFVDVGKAAIACGLIPCEQTSSLYGEEASWYDVLLRSLTDGSLDDFRGNKLSVVTFNYDRSLEHFLFTALKNRWKLEDGDCAELMKVVPIVHVYGQLGTLPELSGGGRKYGGHLGMEAVKQAVADMQVLHEGESSPNLKRAQELLQTAERVCFLGFGYHPTNLKRLRVRDLEKRDVLGSAYGPLGGETYRAHTAFGNVRIELGGADEDVLRLVRASRALI